MARLKPLAVFADLTLLAADGERVTIAADGPVITFTLPRLPSRRWALGPRADRGQRRSLLARLHRALQIADLTLQFKVRRRLVAQLRPASRPTLVSRLLGVGPIEVRLLPGMLALLRA